MPPANGRKQVEAVKAAQAAEKGRDARVSNLLPTGRQSNFERIQQLEILGRRKTFSEEEVFGKDDVSRPKKSRREEDGDALDVPARKQNKKDDEINNSGDDVSDLNEDLTPESSSGSSNEEEPTKKTKKTVQTKKRSRAINAKTKAQSWTAEGSERPDTMENLSNKVLVASGISSNSKQIVASHVSNQHGENFTLPQDSRLIRRSSLGSVGGKTSESLGFDLPRSQTDDEPGTLVVNGPHLNKALVKTQFYTDVYIPELLIIPYQHTDLMDNWMLDAILAHIAKNPDFSEMFATLIDRRTLKMFVAVFVSTAFEYRRR